jgi:hypothetical protein
MPQSGGPEFMSPARHQAARRRKRIVRTVIAAFAITASTFVFAAAPSAQAA